MLNNFFIYFPTIIFLLISFVIVYFIAKGSWNTKEVFSEKIQQPKNILKLGIISFLITFVLGKIYSIFFAVIRGNSGAILSILLPQYSQILSLLLYYSIALIIFTIYLAFQQKKKAGKLSTTSISTIAIGILFTVVFFTQLPSANRISTKETYIKNISNVYNADGTLKHNSDGSLALKTDYGQKTVTKSGNNYALLLFPIITFGVLFYGLNESKPTTSNK